MVSTKYTWFFTTISTSYYINKYDNKKYKLNINFSTDLNKTSLKNINKNFNNIKIILNKSNNFILNLNNIFVFNLKQNNYENIINIIKFYNLNYKTFDMIIKINKYNKFTISNIQKKKLINLLKY